MLNFILGGCKTGKSTCLKDQMTPHLADQETVIVLVPEQFAFEMENRLYGELHASLFNRLQVRSFSTLASRILQTYGDTARKDPYASEMEKMLYFNDAVRACAHRGELQFFGRRGSTPAGLQSLYQLLAKVRRSGMSAAALKEKSAAFDARLALKTADLALILEEYERILAEHQRSDSLVNLTEAAAIAKEKVFFSQSYLYIDEFESFTADQYQMLEVLLTQSAQVSIALRADDPKSTEHPLFAGGTETYRRLKDIAEKKLHLSTKTRYLTEFYGSTRPDLRAAATGVLRRNPGTTPYEGNVHLLEAPDPAAETEYIAAEISRLLAENASLPLEKQLHLYDFAIALKDSATYLPLLTRSLERFGIPFDAAFARPIVHTDLVRYFSSVLTLLSSNTWNTEEILRCLKSPYAGYHINTVSMLEHYCFTWNIEGEDWEMPFYGKEDNPRFERAKPFKGKNIEKLRKHFLGAMKTLRAKCRGGSARTICQALYFHLEERRKNYFGFLKNQPASVETDFRMAWNLVMNVLDTAVQCYQNQTPSLREICDSLLLLLEISRFSLPPQTLDSVRVVDAQTSRMDAPKIVFVPGVSEGVFPGDVAPDGLFTPSELLQLKNADISIARMLPELYADEELIVCKTLAAPSEQLYLTYPLHTLDNLDAAPSGVIASLRTMLDESAWKGEPLFRDIASLPLLLYVRTPEAAYYQYVRHYKENTPEIATLREMLSGLPGYPERLERLDRGDALPDLTLKPDDVSPLLDTNHLVLSPSGIDTFHKCAFRYFCQSILHLYVPERVDLESRNIGNFIHYCLEKILRLCPDRELFASLKEPELRAEIQSLADEFALIHFPESLRRTARFQFDYRQTQSAVLELLEHMQQSVRDDPFEFTGFEVTFSEHPAPGGFPAFSLDEGRVLCQGKIDRIDVDRLAGNMRVQDYKTGKEILVPESLASGQYMQMPIYLFALAQHHAYDEASPAGMLYLPSGPPKREDYKERGTNILTRSEALQKHYQPNGLMLQTACPPSFTSVMTLDEYKAKQTKTPETKTKETKTSEKSKQSSDAASSAESKKGGTQKTASLYLVTEAQMQHLETHVESQIVTMAERIRNGDLPAEPLVRGVERSPCDYCPFWQICERPQEKGSALNAEEKKAALEKVFG